MSDLFWREHVKQDRLEEMYEIFRKRDDATEKNTAIRLARFAEARMLNTADRHIIESEGVLVKERAANEVLVDYIITRDEDGK